MYSHGMLGVSGPERAKTDSESGETEDDEDASIKLSIPAIKYNEACNRSTQKS